jgi:microcystin degradation protein MlrC
MWDPGAVRVAEAAGVGARIALRLGGKTGPGSGDPLDVEADVLSVVRNAEQIAFGAPSPLGTAVALQVEGVTVIANTQRDQVHDPACFSALGVDPRAKKLLVVKSAQHFHAAFAPLAAAILYAEGPGTVATDLSSLPFQHIARPQWPLDKPPFEAFGKTWPR